MGLTYTHYYKKWGFSGGSDSKESSCYAGDPGLIPKSGRSPGKRNGNSLKYFCLGNPMDRGAWRATVYEVARVEHDLKTEQQQFNLLHNRNEHNIVKQLHFNCCCSLQGSSVHGISRHEHRSRLPFPSPGDLPNPGIESVSPALQVDSLPLRHQGSPLHHCCFPTLLPLELSSTN